MRGRVAPLRRAPVVLFCVCGDAQDQHGQNGMIPCGCGCPHFQLDTVDPRHDR